MISSKYNANDGEHILLHLAATEGCLIPEKLKDSDKIYEDYIREVRDVEGFFRKKHSSNN